MVDDKSAVQDKLSRTDYRFYNITVLYYPVPVLCYDVLLWFGINDTFTFIFGKLEIKINCFGTPFYKCSFQCPLIYYIVLHKNIARSIIPERKRNMKGFYVYLGIIDYPIVHAKLWIVHNGTRLNKKISMTCWENNNNINSTS